MKNEFSNAMAAASLFTPATEKPAYEAVIYANDIAQPWKLAEMNLFFRMGG